MAFFVVKSAAKQLGVLLVEEAKYLFEVSKKVKRLQRELQWMGCFLQDADNKEHQDQVMKQWIADIRDIAYEAEDILERYVHGFSNHRNSSGLCNALKRFCCLISDAQTLHDVGSSIDELKSDITELTTRLHTYGIRSVKQSENSKYNTMLMEQRRTYSHTQEPHVVELKKEIENVVNVLVNETEPRVVGIYGMGGLGKTTFARKIYRDADIKQHFSIRAWVYVSQNVERRKVFEEILKGLGYTDSRVKTKDLTDQMLPEEICKILEENKCLIVLDDIWTVGDWKLLEPAFASIKTSSSKILLTTRNELPRLASPDSFSFPLRTLNDVEAWSLLQQKLSLMSRQNKDAITECEMEALGKKMLKHCRGLPLAIITLGGILATKKTIGEWRIVQERIGTYLTSESGEGSGSGGILPMLELSFYELPFYLKPCFLYMGNFPEDYEISAERLYHLWEAEGIVSALVDDEVQLGVSRDEVAERYLNELVQRSMVQVGKCWPNGKIKSCRLHDVVRDICLQKCKEVNFLSVIETTGRFISSSVESRRMRRCAIHLQGYSDAKPFSHQHKNTASGLRSLLFFPLSDKASRIYRWYAYVRKNCTLLRVLDMEDCFIWRGDIRKLVHLRYLSLKGAKICAVPSCLLNLKYLETLDLRIWTDPGWPDYLVPLPSIFSKMDRLRHLYLPRSFVVKGSKNLVIGASDHQLSQMETLKNFDPRVCRREDLLKMTNLRIFSFASLHDCLGGDLWKVMNALGPLLNPLKLNLSAKVLNEEQTTLISSHDHGHIITRLRIEGAIDAKFDNRVFPPSLKKLTLSGCQISKEGIMELEKLPHLEELLLHGGAIREKTMSFSDEGFPELVKLDLFKLEVLEDWDVHQGTLVNLRFLRIYQCLKLKTIPECLPGSINIECDDPCIDGIEKYKYILLQ